MKKAIQPFALSFFTMIVGVSVHASQPLFVITPVGSSTVTVPSNFTATVSYTVRNNSKLTRTLTIVPFSGITQTTTGTGVCQNPFTLAPNESCILNLTINGATMATQPSNINYGPVICKIEGNGNNNPDPFLCEQPSSNNELNIIVSNPLEIGQSYQGGVVACLTSAGDDFNLIAATNNNSEGIQWSDPGTSVPAAQSNDDGQTNTTAIVVATSGQIENASNVCNNFTSDGYSDWYLPAVNQLSCLYDNQAAIGGFDPSNALFWSSTENTTVSDTAKTIRFTNGAQSFDSKGNGDVVRCVRNISNT
ncbi:DUF1566 domain-containing protein [bacterium]|nr:DUF1566 domain-containing protein [bacterium]